MLSIAVPAVSATATTPDRRFDDGPEALHDAREELSAVGRRRSAARSELAELEAERAALEAEFAALTEELAAATDALKDAESALVQTNSRLLKSEQALQQSRSDVAYRRHLYVRRSRVALQLGSAGYTEALLHADDIGEFSRAVDFLRLASARDREAIAELSELEEEVHQAVVDLSALRDDLTDRRLEAAAEEERVAEIVAEQVAVRAELDAKAERTRQLVGHLDGRHEVVRRHVTTLAMRAGEHLVPAVEGNPAHGVINKRDGVHVWLRYRSAQQLYIVAVNRRDGALQIAKKTPGGVQNGGTYHVLARRRGGTYPIPFGRWQHIGASAVNAGNGRVLLRLRIDGVVALEAVDDGTLGGEALTQPGRIGIRGDNTEFLFDDVIVRQVDTSHAELDRLLSDDFGSYGGGLLTNQHPASPQSRVWRMTSGSLFVRDGTAWSGKPDYGRPGPHASARKGNNSAIFRLRTRRNDLRDVEVAFALKAHGMVSGPYRSR